VNAGQLQIASGSIASPTILVQSGATLNVIPLTGLVSTASVTTFGTVSFKGNTAASGGPVLLTVGSLAIGNGGLVSIADPGTANRANRTVLVTSNLTIAGGSNAYNATLDLAGNDMIVHGGSLANLTNEIASAFTGGIVSWNGSGITSSTARADTTHLTALGIILNNNGSGGPIYGSGASLGLFDNLSPAATDVLIKYTYWGDANLTGKVDSADYALIDNGYLSHLTGWYNGDFNYDGVVNGSDYTLIDNAFNQQGAQLSTEIASTTAQIAGSSVSTSVPEPTGLALLGMGVARLLSRRKHRLGDNSRQNRACPGSC
jgi:hypothetical protein